MQTSQLLIPYGAPEIRTPLYLSVQQSYPLHGRLISCFLDTNGGWSVLFCIGCSLSCFYFKIINLAKGHILGQPPIVPNTNSGKQNWQSTIAGEIRSLEPSPSAAPPRSTFFRRFSRCGPILDSPITEQLEGDQSFLWLLIPSLNGRCSLFAETQEQIRGSRELHVWVPKCLSLSLKSVLLVHMRSGPFFHL